MVALILLSSCRGLFDDVYDKPTEDPTQTVAGQIYIDASDWNKWYYIDLPALTDSVLADSTYNTSSAWVAMDIPGPANEPESVMPDTQKPGIYTYWYDVFGQGISHYEFCSYEPSAAQPEPDTWTFAVHRNNVRTNGCTVARTSYHDIDDVPVSDDYLSTLSFQGDTWSDNGVWITQDRMLLGYIGNQGIMVNEVLSTWLDLMIPPVPPTFSYTNDVFVIALPDGTYGALQLVDYMSATGVKCCLTINYKYPLR